MGAAGLGSVFASAKLTAEPNQVRPAEPNAPQKAQEPKYPQLPRRKLGKTGLDVPHLSFGAMFDITQNQLLLRKALQWGINYWDTAHNYAGGNSERGIGMFLKKNPEVRNDIFIVSKASGANSPAEVEKHLQTSLKRMNTDYIDLYYGVHALSNPAQLTDELKQWAADAKKRGLIRYFGFSTHKNMAQNLAAAARLDWIDAIMTTYNFRVMQKPELDAAIDACHKAGIGLIAMKVIAVGQKGKTEGDDKIISHFRRKGFTEEQAKIKAVLEDKRISSALVTMRSVAQLTTNVAAALDKTKLTKQDKAVLKEYAQQSCGGYCAGCADICDAALPGTPYVSDIMRYLMYHNSYGDKTRAKELFAQIPTDVRARLLSTDYSLAEAHCPQRMPIAELMAEAVGKLA